MTTEVSKFITELDKLMVMLEGIDFPQEDDSLYLHDLPERHKEIKAFVTELEFDANSIFIIESGRLAGQADFARHSLLKTQSNGKYYITKGESDSFGWLSGKINTPRGIIVYG